MKRLLLFFLLIPAYACHCTQNTQEIALMEALLAASVVVENDQNAARRQPLSAEQNNRREKRNTNKQKQKLLSSQKKQPKNGNRPQKICNGPVFKQPHR